MTLFTRLPVGIFVVLALVSSAGVAASQPKDPWDSLKKKTAWILLGEINDESMWATQPLYEANLEQPARIPSAGDVIALRMEADLIILDYQQRGETLCMMSPANRLLTSADQTGVKLPASTKVRVDAIEIEKSAYGLHGVWARVGPIR